MTDEMLTMMKGRRKYNSKNNTEYKLLNSGSRSEIGETKGKWLETECEQIDTRIGEILKAMHDIYGKLKNKREVAGVYRYRLVYILKKLLK